MTTGYLAAGACWPTANEAIDAYYSSQQMDIYPATAIHFYRPLKDGSVWKMSDQLTSGATSYTYTLPTNVYGSCTIETAPNYSPPYPTALTCTNCSGGTGSGTPVELWNGTYDYAAAAAAWSFAFVTVMGTWLIAKNIGTILSAIKRW